MLISKCGFGLNFPATQMVHKRDVVEIRIRPLGQELQSVPTATPATAVDFPKGHSWQFEEVVEPMVVLNLPGETSEKRERKK